MVVRLVLLIAFLWAVASGNALAQVGKSRPNIVVVFADDLGYGDLACFGNKKIKTPNLDRMAREGVKFTSFYTAQAVCSASRAAILTGKYPNRVGILGALGPAAKHGLSAEHPTMAMLLKGLGYRTAIFGKWHLGHLLEFLPKNRGFDEYFGLPYSNDMWPKHPSSKFPDLPLISGVKTIELNPDQSKLTRLYTEKAVDFIGRNKEHPFFLYVPHAMPHVPLHVSERFKGKSAGGIYGDVIEEIDWSVGEILAALKKHGLDENTLVIFTSDNGPWLSYGTHSGIAGLLREGKGTAWEGGVRVPFIARWPGQIPSGKEQSEPAMTIDLVPTVAKLTGATLAQAKYDGMDISALLRVTPGAKSPQEAYYFYWDRQLCAVRSGSWKLVFPHTYRSFVGQKGRDDGQPVAYKQAKCGLELYNLDTDIGETRDVSASHPEVVTRLQKLADTMRKDLGDVAPMPAKKAAK